MKIFLYSLVSGFVITVFLLCSFESVKSDISSNVLRLHILANSDSEEDQALKIAVRDKILEKAGHLFSNTKNRGDALDIAVENKALLEDIAINEIKRQGFDYCVNLDFGNFYFPYKNYENLSFPAGNYDALRIEIGEGKGKNWWCVMFPPLCFVDESLGSAKKESLELLKDSLSDESFLYMTETPIIKLKTAEIFKTIKTAFIK